MSNAELLKTAISKKLQITATYDGYGREFCPHAIGWNRDGTYHVMTYQFAGGSSKGLPAGGQWRCFDVDKLSDVQVRHGTWHTGTDHTRPQTCIARIELEVAY